MNEYGLRDLTILKIFAGTRNIVLFLNRGLLCGVRQSVWSVYKLLIARM